jgi:hypothetical protein
MNGTAIELSDDQLDFLVCHHVRDHGAAIAAVTPASHYRTGNVRCGFCESSFQQTGDFDAGSFSQVSGARVRTLLIAQTVRGQ